MKFISSLFALAVLAVLASARPTEPSPPKGPDYIAAEHTWNCQNGFMDFIGHPLGFCGDDVAPRSPRGQAPLTLAYGREEVPLSSAKKQKEKEQSEKEKESNRRRPSRPELPVRSKSSAGGKPEERARKDLRGTGGTALIPFLRQARDETGEPAVDAWARRVLSKGRDHGSARERRNSKIEVQGLASVWHVDDSDGGLCLY
ncbi:hypothetical protein B0A55_03595 [Friedmanniomyces simplex]|uniref:Uncharacterized protein n=1 Tax=Friedmanniomyces simplex TaxID=329884 RepID=A0A4U0XRH9_9PEZI|nr:hypothetical protein B0A55_03595 [Friedmanniomyces simplex]